MATVKKKNKTVIIVCSIVSAVLCIGMVVLGLLMRASERTGFDYDRSLALAVKSESDLKNRGKSIFNDDITLENDIHITDPELALGSSEQPFVGTFNGNGHSVIFDFKKASAASPSFFGVIGSEASITNVKFSFGEVDCESSVFYGIAAINYGSITNCKVDFGELKIAGRGIYSPLIGINNGSLTNVVVVATLSAEGKDTTEAVYGGICACNGGTVKNSIAYTRYDGVDVTDGFSNLTGEKNNTTVAAVASAVSTGSTVENTVAVVDFDAVVSDRYAPGVTVYGSAAEAFNETVVWNTLNFDNRYWALASGELDPKSGSDR